MLVHVNSKYQPLSIKEFILYELIGIFVITFLISIIHESGHAIFVLLFGGKIVEFRLFPLTLFMDGSLNSSVHYYGVFTEEEKVLIMSGGTLSTLIVGLIMLYIIIKYDMRPVFELWALLFGFILIFDIFSYSIHDMISFFFITDISGDWSKIFTIIPELVYIIIFLDIVIIVLSFYVILKNRKKEFFSF